MKHFTLAIVLIALKKVIMKIINIGLYKNKKVNQVNFLSDIKLLNILIITLNKKLDIVM